jgi:DNA invertase Pin-like site-specific DNA recombinase
MKKIAIYLRVSTSDQSTDLQRREIIEFCNSRGWEEQYSIFEDKLSGTNGNRPELKAMLKQVREGKFNIVVCWKLDRLFRSLKDIVTLLHEFEEINVEFISIKDHFDLTTAAGRMLMHVISAFAEFEASLIRERVKAGIANAREAGVILGRPKSIDVDEVLRLHEKGLSMGSIAKIMGIAKSSVHRVLSSVPKT